MHKRWISILIGLMILTGCTPAVEQVSSSFSSQDFSSSVSLPSSEASPFSSNSSTSSSRAPEISSSSPSSVPAYSYTTASDPFADAPPLTLQSDSHDPISIGRELFCKHMNRYLDLTSIPFMQIEDYTITDIHLLAGTGVDFCIYVVYDAKPVHPKVHPLTQELSPPSDWATGCYLEMRITETEPDLYTYVTSSRGETLNGLIELSEYAYDPLYNYAKNPPELYKPCRVSSTISNRVEIGKALLSAYFDRYLDPNLPEQWRLSRYEINDGYWLGGSLKKFCVELFYDWTPLLHPLATRLTAFGGSADGAGGYQNCRVQLIVEQQADGSYEMVAQGSEIYDIGLSPRPQSEKEAKEG